MIAEYKMIKDVKGHLNHLKENIDIYHLWYEKGPVLATTLDRGKKRIFQISHKICFDGDFSDPGVLTPKKFYIYQA